MSARDEATATIVKASKDQAAGFNEVAAAASNASGAVDQHGMVSSRLQGVIKEERSEHRMRAFAMRETAMAATDLSNTFVGENGLVKGAQAAMGSMYSLEFAIRAAGATAGGMKGTVGEIGAVLGKAALPLAGVVAATLALVEANNQLNDRIEKANERIRLASVSFTALELAQMKYKKATEETVSEPWYSEIAKYLPGVEGALASLVAHWFGVKEVIAQTKEKTADTLEAQRALAIAAQESEEKYRAALVQSVGTLTTYNKAVQEGIELRLQLEGKDNPKQKIADATAELKIAQDNLAHLKYMGAAAIDLVNAENAVTQALIKQKAAREANSKLEQDAILEAVAIGARHTALLHQRTDETTAASAKVARASLSDFNSLERELIAMSDRVGTISLGVISTFSSGLTQAFVGGITGTQNFAVAFEQMAVRVLEKLIDMVIEATLFNILMGFLTGGMGTVLQAVQTVPLPGLPRLVNPAPGVHGTAGPGAMANMAQSSMSPPKSGGPSTINIHFHGDTIDPNTVVANIRTALRQTGMSANQLLVDRHAKATYVQ